MPIPNTQNSAFTEDEQFEVPAHDVDDGWSDRRYSGDLIGDCDTVRAMQREAVCLN